MLWALKKTWVIALFQTILPKEQMRLKTLSRNLRISKLISMISRLIMLRVLISQFKARLKLKNCSIKLTKNFSTSMKRERTSALIKNKH
jgi:hypothetical protein